MAVALRPERAGGLTVRSGASSKTPAAAKKQRCYFRHCLHGLSSCASAFSLGISVRPL
ncbi:hypothetical protein ACFSUJ_23600 [Streptomyces lusitanus]|uniref:Uncharacterized protein n=1 Tax=Streptomyces lusitanus TaxID=68232 RepID=A0ABU3JS06_9ACTN|nr:hypothetical protein [Streptomyces lusitanus]